MTELNSSHAMKLTNILKNKNKFKYSNTEYKNEKKQKTMKTNNFYLLTEGLDAMKEVMPLKNVSMNIIELKKEFYFDGSHYDFIQALVDKDTKHFKNKDIKFIEAVESLKLLLEKLKNSEKSDVMKSNLKKINLEESMYKTDDDEFTVFLVANTNLVEEAINNIQCSYIRTDEKNLERLEELIALKHKKLDKIVSPKRLLVEEEEMLPYDDFYSLLKNIVDTFENSYRRKTDFYVLAHDFNKIKSEIDEMIKTKVYLLGPEQGVKFSKMDVEEMKNIFEKENTTFYEELEYLIIFIKNIQQKCSAEQIKDILTKYEESKIHEQKVVDLLKKADFTSANKETEIILKMYHNSKEITFYYDEIINALYS
jgi:hypothetical protein